jgi:uncharacterized protein YceK
MARVRRLLLVAAATVLVLAGCGSSRSTQGPTAEIEDCLTEAGAQIATDRSELAFAEPWAVSSETVHPDQSGTLSVGSYRGRGSGGWAVYYVARRGFRVSLAVLTRQQPIKSARVVAYIHPKEPAAMNAANTCLETSRP